jgi:hypothetical protein
LNVRLGGIGEEVCNIGFRLKVRIAKGVAVDEEWSRRGSCSWTAWRATPRTSLQGTRKCRDRGRTDVAEVGKLVIPSRISPLDKVGGLGGRTAISWDIKGGTALVLLP